MKILVVNSGSSSIKFELFNMPEGKSITKGIIEHIGEKGTKVNNHYAGLKIIFKKISKVHAIGHRVVHGAEAFKKPVLINKKVISKIRKCSKLAPLHQLLQYW